MVRPGNKLSIAICTTLIGAFSTAHGATGMADEQSSNNVPCQSAAATSSPTSVNANGAMTANQTANQSTSSAVDTRTSPSGMDNTAAGNANTADTTTGNSYATSGSALTSASTEADQQNSDRSNSSSTANTPGTYTPGSSNSSTEVVWFVVPVAMQEQGSRMSNGCWVRLYSGENFRGRSLSIVGPTAVANLHSPYGTGLDNWESAQVGPHANVRTYDSENFQAHDATLHAGQSYPDLGDSKLGLLQDIESIRVSCDNAATPGSTGTAGTSGSSGPSASGSM